jgi:transposase
MEGHSPMKKRTYASVAVNRVHVEALCVGRAGQNVVVGLDVGKWEVRSMMRWQDGTLGQGWKIAQPSQLGELITRLRELAQGRQLLVALEPTGTYGEPLRQALTDAGLAVLRISPKAAHDYAEIFDGVPSQHDGKDAAVVAELAALGKGRAWPFVARTDWEEELAFWVDELDVQQRQGQRWASRLEGLLARHWPEATRRLPLTSGTLLRALAHYGDPRRLAADAQASARLWRWSYGQLVAAGQAAVLADAQHSVGVRLGRWSRRQLRRYAQRALAVRRRAARARRALRRLAQGHAVLQAQGRVVGVPTACVLWACLGDPRDYDSAAAYRKAMGLNLAERSSGAYQGQLRISKRGQALVRQWLYFAALRLAQQEPVWSWFEAKKTAADRGGRCAAVAVMRKLALGLYQVARSAEPFDVRRLFTVEAGSGTGAKSSGKPRGRSRRERRPPGGSATQGRARQG